MGILSQKLGCGPVKGTELLVASAVTGILVLCALQLLPWPECPFHKFLHIDCPMCGTTRAVILAVHGNCKAAFSENPIWWLWLFWSIMAFLDLWHRVVRVGDTLGEHLMSSAMRHCWVKMAHLILAFSTLVYRNLVR